MATILAYTSPAIGHLFPMTPLLLELQARGHDVHVRTVASRVDLMRDLGFHTDAIDPAIPAVIHPDWEASNPKQALEVAISTFCERGAIDGPDFQKALDEVVPDTVLVDINAWGALNAARGVGRSVDRVQPLHAADQLRRHAAVRSRAAAQGRSARDASATPWSAPSSSGRPRGR